MSDQAPPPPPEYLTPDGGRGVPQRSTPSGRRGLLVGGGVLGLAALGAAAALAYQAFFATGAQPSEALPDSTIGYLSIDLDPSGAQKLEALQTLEKFPAIAEQLDIDERGDLREEALGLVQDLGACQDVDFDDDVAPWLGNRIGIAAVDLGEDVPAPVAVIEVSDAGAADEGLEQLRTCATSAVLGDAPAGAEPFGWSIEGDWAVLAQTDSLADDVTAAAGEDPLSDDDTYQRWTDAAGDPGILSAYLAPSFGETVIQGLGAFGTSGPGDPGMDSETQAAQGFLRDFEGAALTVRFEDEGLELETASGSSGTGEALETTDVGRDLVEGLPESTAVAFGVGLQEGWAQALLDYVTPLVGEEDVAQFLDDAESEAGLVLPEDAETLLGEGVAVALDGGVPAQELEESGAGVGVLTQGDTDAVADVLDRFRAALEAQGEDAAPADSDVEGDLTALGPDSGWREDLLAGGGLGDSDAFAEVMDGAADSAALLFVDFDSDLFAGLAGEGDPEVRDNLEPLGALGASSWVDGEESHLLVRLTTD